MNNAQYVNQTSGKVEYYTPAAIIDAARRVMGRIDLDPASSPVANQVVQATRFFTEADDGLRQEWHGSLWLNHPFGKEANPRWISKLVQEYRAGHVAQACCITYASTSERWFTSLFDFPICFLRPRTNYLLPDGSIYRGVTKGSALTYLGGNVAAFVREFTPLGAVMMRQLT